jgi:nanoRNase/pAp phosphatase (c-di-AMP/oligoRNAs hydrolase)
MYAILGCGSKGAIVAEKLKKNNKAFFVIEKDPRQIENLRNLGYDTRPGDITCLGLEHNFSQVEALVILSQDLETTYNAVREARKKTRSAYVITRATDTAAGERLLEAGADKCINPGTLLGDKVVSELESFEAKERTEQLKGILLNSNSTGVAIIAHNNPDPDSLASALAFKTICDQLKVKSEIYYSGKIDRLENRAFANTMENALDMKLHRLENQSEALKCVNNHSKIVLVDSPAPGANNILPENIIPNIIIDHHTTSSEISADFVNIRNDIGSTATLMTKYLQQFGVTIPPALASALFYGLSVDTNSFTRDVSHTDLEVASFLSAIADRKMIDEFRSPPMTEDTMEVIGTAIQNRKKFKDFLLSCVGIIENQDAIPQAAEYLLQLKDVSSVLVYGIIADRVHMSARTKEITVNIGETLVTAFKDKGRVGGHPSYAGGYVDLGILANTKDKRVLIAIAQEVVESSFLDAAGVKMDEEAAGNGVSSEEEKETQEPDSSQILKEYLALTKTSRK